MTKEITRRTFVKAAAGLLSFAATFKYLGVDRVFDAKAQEIPPPADEVIPNYLSGNVQEVTSSGFIAESGQGKMTVIFDANTRVWKKDWSRALPIEEGDRFAAWGQPPANGSYTPEKIWFNIVNIYGVVGGLTIAADRVAFNLSGGRHDVAFLADSSARLVQGEGEADFNPSSPPFRDGDFIHVVGVRTVDGLIATRILA